ncbi:MAG: helix-hairpin-helix domain-containing protein, partial [Terriglobia bacterium]
VDCVGACVGMKGMRVQSIIRELRGENIDIIEHNDDPVTFAATALSPAKINHVSIVDSEEKNLEVIVDDSQLSLAIGKKGQNVRLAAKLLGWHIDIKSEEEKRQEIETQMAAMARRGAAVRELAGLGEKTLQKLKDHGIETVEQLAQMTPDELTQIPGIGEKTVEKIRQVVIEYFEQGEQADQAELVEQAEQAQPAADENAAVVTEGEAEAAVVEVAPEGASASEEASEKGETQKQETASAEAGAEPAAAAIPGESEAVETNEKPERPAEAASEEPPAQHEG